MGSERCFKAGTTFLFSQLIIKVFADLNKIFGAYLRDIKFILKSALNTLTAELNLVNRIAEKSNNLEQSMSESDWKKS